MRVVVDTNLVVSATLSATGAAAEIMRRWRQETFELLISEPILAEYERTLGYDKLRTRHRLTDKEIHELVIQFERFATLVAPTQVLAIIEADPDDNKFIECAVAGTANVIVTRDEHLLALRTYNGIQILSPAAFLAFLNTLS